MVDEGVSVGGSWPEGGSEDEPSSCASQEGGAGMRVVTEKSEGREVMGAPLLLSDVRQCPAWLHLTEPSSSGEWCRFIFDDGNSGSFPALPPTESH